MKLTLLVPLSLKLQNFIKRKKKWRPAYVEVEILLCPNNRFSKSDYIMNDQFH